MSRYYRYAEILYLLLLTTSHSSRLATPATSGTSVLRMVTDSGGTETTTLREESMMIEGTPVVTSATR